MKKFKMPSAFTILFVIIIIVAVLTFIIPAGAYDYTGEASGTPEPIPGTYREIERNPQRPGCVPTAGYDGYGSKYQ